MLRLLLPPLVIAAASLGQRHLGDRFGGLLVGLPLTSGTFLGLLLPAHGPLAVADAAVGVLAGQVAVIVMTVAYARLARLARVGIAAALVGCLACWGVAIMAVRPVTGLVLSSVIFAAVALVSLRTWPASTTSVVSRSVTAGGRELTMRVLLASALVISLTSGVDVLGPQLAGVLSAAPLVALVLTPTTHHERGEAAVVMLLHGVAKGSVSAATFALVLALSVEAMGSMAFLLATSAAAAVAALLSTLRPMHSVVAPRRPEAGQRLQRLRAPSSCRTRRRSSMSEPTRIHRMPLGAPTSSGAVSAGEVSSYGGADGSAMASRR